MKPPSSWVGGLGAHPAPGDRIGRHRLGPLLGAGGMATVYRATDERGAAVAIKILNPARVQPEDVKRFTREYKALSRMDHENVVHVYEAGVHQGYPWIALELVEGHDLETEIARWRERPPEDRWGRIFRILRGMCHGLGYIHELGLVHRDLKPGNVLLTRDGEAKISDFGVVKADNTQSTQLTMAGRLVGTVAFMAPELITDEGVDRRTDLYALGAVLYLMCTHRRPIEADSVAGYLARHLTEVPRPIGELEPSCPAVLERIAARLLQKDRAYRYPSAAAVVQALERPEDPEVPPLRGRDELSSAFGRHLMALEEGAGGIVALVGPEGAGKSHLLRTLVDQVHAQGVRVGLARAVREGPSIGQQLCQSLGERAPARPWETLARSAHAPIVLAVDDLDAEPETVAELLSLLRRTVGIDARPMLLVFTAVRIEDDLGALVDGAGSGVPSATWPVGPLDAKAIAALLRDRGAPPQVAAILARRLHSEHKGLPGGIVLQLEALFGRGWLTAAKEGNEATRPLEDFRRAELPVPEVVRRRVLQRFERLDPAARELCELLAILDRPVSGALLERCRPNDPRTPRWLDALVQQAFLLRTEAEGQEVLTLADPGAARVIRGELPEPRRRSLHAAVAEALGAKRRRTGNSLEVAHHLRAAGDEASAWPLFVQAARRAAREGRPAEVLDICEHAEEVRAAGEAAMPEAEAAHNRRWQLLLQGEALLARRCWDEAVQPLEAAARAAAIEHDPGAIARTKGSLGRAHYRRGHFELAEPLLRAALGHAEPAAPERASALRALADIALRAGRYEDAEVMWTEALSASRAMGSKDAEARARRGLAHLRAIQGQLEVAATLLGEADDLLVADGDVRVRAGILARALELDAASGRLASALYRAELLIELCRHHGMSERLPEAYGLLAALLTQLGDRTEAEDAAQQALVFAKATESRVAFARLYAARVLCDIGRWDAAREALPTPEELTASTPADLDALSDPAAQHAALRARLLASEHPTRAKDLATWALGRPAPRLLLAGVRIATDVARALTSMGQAQAARNAVKHGLRLLGSGGDGLRLELLVTMQLASPDPRVVEAIKIVSTRMLPGVPPQHEASFRGRAVVREALATPDPR